jgi:hypothetical protein
MWRQQTAEATASARDATAAQNAADRAAERSAAQVTAFRVRMARQRAAEEAVALKDIATAERALDAQIASARGGISGLSGVMVGGARSAKGLQLAALDLSRQLADVGVTAIMGMSPFMILVQQGPQIADRLALMKQEGVGLSAALQSLGVSLGVLKTTMPAAVAEAAALAATEQAAALASLEVAVANRATAKSAVDAAKAQQAQAATAFDAAAAETALAIASARTVATNEAAAGAADALAGANARVAETAAAAAAAETVALAPLAVILGGIAIAIGVAVGAFGLFEREIDKNTKHATSWGDTWKALITVVGDRLMNGPIGEGLRWLDKEWSKLLDGMTAYAFNSVTSIAAAFTASYKTIASNWDNLPGALEAIFVAAVNKAIDALESLVKAQDGVLGHLKAFIGLLNPTLKAALDALKGVDLDALRPKASANAKKASADFDKFYREDLRSYRKALRDFGDDVARQADREYEARQKASKGAGRHAKALKEVEDAYAKAREETDRYLEAIGKEQATAGMSPEQVKIIEAQAMAAQAIAIGYTNAAMAILRYADALILAEGMQKPDKGEGIIRASDVLPDLEGLRLTEVTNELSLINDLVRDAGAGMEDAFGRAGGALSGLLEGLSEYRVRLAEINEAVHRNDLTPEQGARERAAVQIKTYGDMTAAAQGFFKEGSKGWKALHAAEQVFRAFEFAMAVKSLFFKAAEVTATATGVAAKVGSVAPTVAADTAIAASGTAAGAGKIFSQLGMWAFPVIAAMVAVMAALGSRGGGGGAAAVNPVEERRAQVGAGTVLGDSEAKSESIARSLEIAASNSNKDLEYSNGMLRALRSIDQNIGALTGVLARQIGVSGSIFDSSGLGLGSKTSLSGSLLTGPARLMGDVPIIGGILKSLFGTKKTTTLLDQGLDFDSQALSDILGGGLAGSSYQDVQTQTKKKFFGIGIGGSTKTKTTESPLEEDILTEMQRVIESLRGGVLEAAGALGVEGAEAALAAFTVDIGRISFKDRTGEEIQAELDAVFGKLGDQMASTVLPAIAEFQKAGEGAFETLVRVARQYQVIDITLSSIGMTFGAVGVASLGLRENLIDLFGSLDEFVQQTSFFAENFLTEAERMAPIQAAVVKEFQRLGVTGVNTKDQFKQLVLGLDLTTEAGRQMYAAMLAFAPAFAKVFDFLNPELKDAARSVDDLRSDLTKAYQREADALQGTIDKFRSFSDSLKAFRKSLDAGPNALLSPEAQYTATKADFEQTAAKARLGDATALGDLQNVSQAYLDASKSYYASSGRYFQDLAAVKTAVEAAGDTASRTADNATAQLTALQSQVSSLISIDTGVKTLAEISAATQQAIVALQAALTAQAAAGGTVGGVTTPFSPLSPTGPGYTYTPPVPTSPLPTPPTATDPLGGTGGGYQIPDYVAYVEKYADLKAAWAASGMDEYSFGAYHWGAKGQGEGRDLPTTSVPGFDPSQLYGGGFLGFDTGGSFDVPGSGPKDFGPVTLHGGETANISRRDTMDALLTEVRGLRKDNEGLKAEVVALRSQVARGDEVNAEETRRGSSEIARSLRNHGQTNRLRDGG